MGQRRQSRELALQALYYIDVCKDDSERAYRLFCKHFEPEENIRDFFEKIVKGTIENKADIDKLIETHSSNWRLSRMSGVDRNVIRISVYEILYCSDIPSTVAINEAIDIGKKFGTKDSGAFINGILDAISQNIEK
jgi:N utilization substance protein B